MSSLYKSSSLLLSDYDRIHYWVAGISIIEALVHSVIAVILKIGKADIVSQIITWTVCLASPATTVIWLAPQVFSIIIIVLLSMFAIPTSRYYEVFVVTH
jgi:hypothetical protein